MRLISSKKLFIGFVSNICSYVANFPAKKLRKNTVLKNTHAPVFLKIFSDVIVIKVHLSLMLYIYIMNKSQ